MSSAKTQMPAAAKLREVLDEKDKILVCPGIYDGFTARIALAAGFDALYMVGWRTRYVKNQVSHFRRQERELPCRCLVKQIWE